MYFTHLHKLIYLLRNLRKSQNSVNLEERHVDLIYFEVVTKKKGDELRQNNL